MVSNFIGDEYYENCNQVHDICSVSRISMQIDSKYDSKKYHNAPQKGNYVRVSTQRSL